MLRWEREAPASAARLCGVRGMYARLMPKDDDDEFDDEDVIDESEQDDESLVDIGESSLSYFGADLDVGGLVRRLKEGDIIVPRFDPDESEGATLEGFQRQRVWPPKRSEKFIESLLLGWPVPSIFLVQDEDQRYLVLDGQQRLTALQMFEDERFRDGKPFVLKDVAEHLQGATYGTLSPESKRRFNNTFIQGTIIEPQGEDGRESVYRLFGRLNSGGMQLNPQEIRVALYRGPIVDWVRSLNAVQAWRDIFGAKHRRLKDHELILRSLALREAVEKLDGKWTNAAIQREAYRPPMSDFLNGYLSRNRSTRTLPKKQLREEFTTACELVRDKAGRDGLRFYGTLNAAHVDALISSLMYLVDQGANLTPTGVERSIQDLRNSEQYTTAVTTSTSHRESVVQRLRLAVTELRQRARK